MNNNHIFSKSFSRVDRKWFGRCCAIFILLGISLSLKMHPHLQYSLSLIADNLKMQLNTNILGRDMLMADHDDTSVITPIIQNLTNSRSQVYEINGDIRIHRNSSTIFIATTQQLKTTIKPYARTMDRSIMKNITTLKITNQNPNSLPPCTRSFDIPAVLFSTGGYPNLFHHFSDVLIPLYLTSRQFNTAVVFLVVDKHPRLISKYKLILNMLSQHDVIDIHNNSQKNEVLCFRRITAGLKSHRELGLDRSMPDFTRFLRNTYSLERDLIDGCRNRSRRPRLLVVSREETRRLRNEYDVAELARSVGFEASVREMGREEALVARLVNGFDVMVAVHGAGITNMVYLAEKAVLVQIVPFGLQGLARVFYEEPCKGMNLRYLEYRVSVKESSLMERYGVGDEVFRNPSTFRHKGWDVFRSVYMENQHVTVDLDRFRRTLLEAMDLVCG